LEEVYDWLVEQAVSVSVATQTGTITLEVVTDWPDLSLAIAARLVDEVTRFNMEVRQSQAAAERSFISARVDSAEAELRAAEGVLQGFMESNRQFEDSPLLLMQYERIQREVSRKNAVLETLLQSHEQARIAEVRDTPVITLIQVPFLPPGPDRRRLVLRAALGIVLGGMAGILLAFVVEAIRSPVPGDPAREDFMRSWEGLVRSIPLVGRKA
jgi:capsule polysaccharide export protein KpsE/RkpR